MLLWVLGGCVVVGFAYAYGWARAKGVGRGDAIQHGLENGFETAGLVLLIGSLVFLVGGTVWLLVGGFRR